MFTCILRKILRLKRLEVRNYLALLPRICLFLRNLFLTFKEQQQLKLHFVSRLVWVAFLVWGLVCLQVASLKDRKRPKKIHPEPLLFQTRITKTQE